MGVRVSSLQRSGDSEPSWPEPSWPEPPKEPGNPPDEPGNPPKEPGNPPEEPGNPPEEPGNPPEEPGNSSNSGLDRHSISLESSLLPKVPSLRSNSLLHPLTMLSRSKTSSRPCSLSTSMKPLYTSPKQRQLAASVSEVDERSASAAQQPSEAPAPH